jgi:eukaryotic-like serine/threonine-protein kinase
MLDQLFETQHLIRQERSGTGPQQRTTVLPAATTRVQRTADTQVVRPRERSAALPIGSAQRLTQSAERAKRRGAWAFGIVLLAGLLAAGTGWWFGAGPGGLTTTHASSAPALGAAAGLPGGSAEGLPPNAAPQAGAQR